MGSLKLAWFPCDWWTDSKYYHGIDTHTGSWCEKMVKNMSVTKPGIIPRTVLSFTILWKKSQKCEDLYSETLSSQTMIN